MQIVNPLTAECVSPMHPDKICDRISDAILDECLRQDPLSRVAIETMGGHGKVTITGELTTKADVDIKAIVKRIVPSINDISENIVAQSNEIAQGVDIGGAGDQGIVVGGAFRENDQMMPTEYYVARQLAKFLYNRWPNDGKTQVTLKKQGMTMLASWSKVNGNDLNEAVREFLTNSNYLINQVTIITNPAGDWNTSGFDADTGVTGRKIVVDAYGPRVQVGGGAFSGKDATKVDRSGAYMLRKIAIEMLNSVGFEQIGSVVIQAAYAIGRELPVALSYTYNGGMVVLPAANKVFEHMERMKPKNIIDELGLRTPQFEKLAEWGHFGNNSAWDK